MTSCAVCEEREQKYRCPTCKIFYCSVACFKLHKESSSCEKKPIATLNDEPDSNPQSLIYVDPEDDEESVVPEEALERLGESEELKALLRNPHLRGYLRHIDTTHNPRGFMKIAMQEPLFVEFADACMKVIHPEVADGAGALTDEQVTAMLKEQIDEAEEKDD